MVKIHKLLYCYTCFLRLMPHTISIALMNVSEIIHNLSNAPGLPGLFNPYSDRCTFHDLPDGPAIRRQNLYRYLKAHQQRGTRQLWIAEAASYLGSRRSGVYLLPETHFEKASRDIGAAPFQKATKTPVRGAPTATFLWDIMAGLPEIPVAFNALPFHPHQLDNELSNRAPTKKEITQNLVFLEMMIEMFQPQQIIVIGRKAEYACSKINFPNMQYVRHPSQGGRNIFLRQIREIYALVN